MQIDPCYQQLLEPGAVEFRRLTESNFRGVEVVDRPVKPPSNLVSSFSTQSLKMTEFFSVQFIQYQKTQ